MRRPPSNSTGRCAACLLRAKSKPRSIASDLWITSFHPGKDTCRSRRSFLPKCVSIPSRFLGQHVSIASHFSLAADARIACKSLKSLQINWAFCGRAAFPKVLVQRSSEAKVAYLGFDFCFRRLAALNLSALARATSSACPPATK